MIFYEAPHKLTTTVQDLLKAFGPDRRVSFCRELTKESLLSIGFQFGRDYTTVIASIKAVERDMRHDPEFASNIENLRASFAI